MNCHGEELFTTVSTCVGGAWATQAAFVMCPDCPNDVPTAGEACSSDGKMCQYHPVNCHGDELYNTTSTCEGNTWTTKMGQAAVKPQPAHCTATGDVITEGEAVFALESGCRWTTD